MRYRIPWLAVPALALACVSSPQGAPPDGGISARVGGALPLPAGELAQFDEYRPHPGLTEALLPESYDLGYYFPPPGDQGQVNSCVAWAAGYGVMTYLKSRQRGELARRGAETAPERWFSPDFLHDGLTKSENGATRMHEALQSLTRTGCAPYPAFPPFSREVPDEARRLASRYRLGGFQRVEVRDRVVTKLHLFDETPLLIVIPYTHDLITLGPDEVWQGPSQDPIGHHALVITGYDDSRQAFRVLNSWGPRWADGGYGWLSYRFVETATDHAFVALDGTDEEVVGLWRAHGHRVHDFDRDLVHVSWDVELDLQLHDHAVEGTLVVVMSWLRLDAQGLVSRATQRTELSIEGILDRGLFQARCEPVEFQLRFGRMGTHEPIVHAIRSLAGRGPEVAGPLGTASEFNWRATRPEDVRTLLRPLRRGLSAESVALLPSPAALEPVQLVARPAAYGDALRLVLGFPDHDVALTCSRYDPSAGSPLVRVDGEDELFWHDRDALRRLRTRYPADEPPTPDRLASLPPRGEGLPVVTPIQVVQVEGELWLLESGLRRRASATALARMNLPAAAPELSRAVLETYPQGPPLD